MFLDFTKIKEQMPVIEKREEQVAASEKYYDVVLKAESLDDVKDVPTEDLARVVLGMNEYVNGDSIAEQRFKNTFARAVSCERVRMARLL